MRAANITASSPWRYLAAPLAVWLVVLLGAVGGLAWIGRGGRLELEHRFRLRADIAADFVATYATDLIARQRAQAVRFMSTSTVGSDTFVQSVAAFGYPAAVLLDADGRVLHAQPPVPGLIGTDVTTRYAHLRTAVRDNVPAV